MITLGLTGGIGMGKSAVTSYLLSKNIPVWDADKAAADLYEPNSGLWYLHGREFRELVACQDKAEARARVEQDSTYLSVLSAAAAPFLLKQATTFITDMRRLNKPIVVLDVPLLFESDWDKQLKLDVTVTVSCNAPTQFERVLKRPGMTRTVLANVIANQMSDYERRERATFIIDTGGEIEHTYKQAEAVVLLANNYRLHR